MHALVDVEQATQKAAPDPIPPGTTLPQPGPSRALGVLLYLSVGFTLILLLAWTVQNGVRRIGSWAASSKANWGGSGGRRSGAISSQQAEAENLRGQIDYDVRTAFLNLNAAKEQVDVAHQNVDLANDNVARSKERFAAGVTDSVEVVQSEQSLASANDQYITSLYSHNLAKLALARALGVARTNFSQYLGGR